LTNVYPNNKNKNNNKKKNNKVKSKPLELRSRVKSFSFEHECYSSFDICHPGSVWVVLCNLQDYHMMISIFCPNGHFMNLIIALKKFQLPVEKFFVWAWILVTIWQYDLLLVVDYDGWKKLPNLCRIKKNSTECSAHFGLFPPIRPLCLPNFGCFRPLDHCGSWTWTTVY
jgi:hypothetical protein